MSTVHVPVMLNEVIEYIDPKPGDNFIDCTYGGGGHSNKIIEKIKPSGKLLAIDANQEALGKQNENIIFVNSNFRNLKQIIKDNFKYPVNGILLDLGLSSDELETSGRGFTFLKNEPLDMRFDVNQELTAAKILNSYSKQELYDIFIHYGQYAAARVLSKNIFDQRKIKKFETTRDLVEIVEATTLRRGKTHPATKIFQALRIAVNEELKALEEVLPQAIEVLEKGGRLAVISFHSLEDKIVKQLFKEESKKEKPVVKLLTKKPLVPNFKEVQENLRSRSAKLRVIEKI